MRKPCGACCERNSESGDLPLKTKISVPEHIVRSADDLAALLGISRSDLCYRAIRELLARHESIDTTERLDAVDGTSAEPVGLDPALAALQSATLVIAAA